MVSRPRKAVLWVAQEKNRGRLNPRFRLVQVVGANGFEPSTP